MKYALLGDTHFSIRSGDKRFIKYFDKIYTEWFFPIIKSKKIKTIYQLGDLFDKRVANDNFAVSEANRYFFDVIEERGIDILTLIGNHDAYHKNTIVVNSPEILLSKYNSVSIYKEPTTVHDFDFIPWICKDNADKIFEFIEKSKSKYCLAHAEIDGFSMYKGVKSYGGLSKELFKKYKKVFSGHYHTQSIDGNIHYIGTPGEYTWSDYDDPKGFHIFDTETGDTEFVQNPFTMFQKLDYVGDEQEPIDFTQLTDKFVRLYVHDVGNRKLLDKFVDGINNANPHELKIVEQFVSVASYADDDINVKDTPALIENYVDNMDTELDKERLKRALRQFYLDAQTTGDA